jgi:hypothetical protein
MPDDSRRDLDNLDDLDHALFDRIPSAPPLDWHAETADLESALFGRGESTRTDSYGAGVGYAPPPLSRTRRVLVALGVVTLVALGVTATVAFQSSSEAPPASRVVIPAGAKVTSTSVVLRAPLSLPVASIPDPTTTAPDTTTTTRRRATTPSTEAPPETQPTEPPTEPPPTDPPTTAAPTTSLPATTTTLVQVP